MATPTYVVSGELKISIPLYQWTKNNGSQTQIQVGADPKVLSFSPLKLSDAGLYSRQATVSSPYLTNNITAAMGSQKVSSAIKILAMLTSPGIASSVLVRH